MVHIKDPLLLIEKGSPCSGDSGNFLLLSGPLQYFRRHITVNKVSRALSIKTYFLPSRNLVDLIIDVFLSKTLLTMLQNWKPLTFIINAREEKWPQVRSECLTCTFRASCCSARLSWAQVPTFAGKWPHVTFLIYAPCSENKITGHINSRNSATLNTMK